MLKSLTSFRFFAAFMVYLTHCVGLARNYQFGYIGVSFFFVISGFILVYNYHSKFTELNIGTIMKFYKARLAKIYPVHLLTFVISLPYVFFILRPPVFNLDFFSGAFANLFLIQSFIPLPFGTVPYSFNQVSWSLSNELFFYFSFPFIVFILLKLQINSGVSKSLLVAMFFFIGVFCVTTLSAFFREAKMDDWYYYVFPLFRSLDFIMGILIGLIFVTKNKGNIVINRPLFDFLEIATLILLISWIAFAPHISQKFRFSVYFVPMWCVLIYVFAFQGGIVSKLLSNKWLVFLGEISFSFYMIHLIFINYIGLLPMGSLINHIITLFGSILLSALIYVTYEEPLRKKIRFGAKKKEKLEHKVTRIAV